MFNLQKIFEVMGPFQLIVVAVLAIMAVASLAVFVERLWTYTRSRTKSQRFGQKAASCLRAHDYGQFLEGAEKEKGNQLASLLGVGMKKYLDAAAEPESDVTPIELTRRELERCADTISAQLRRGLNVLASVGSTAPFVGLLGTVLGIIGAFQSLDSEGMNLEKLSGAIGEALIVTALGLMVAIPAVLMFNFLSARADGLEMAIDQSRGQFVDHIEAYAERKDMNVRRKGPAPDINVTPLVDIVLVLLIIFMVVVPQLEAGVTAMPPVASHVDPESKGQAPLIITVTKHGEVYIDKALVTDLEKSLRAEHKAAPNRPVQIRGDINARYGDVRRVFLTCQEVGIPGVPLEVGEKDKEKS